MQSNVTSTAPLDDSRVAPPAPESPLVERPLTGAADGYSATEDGLLPLAGGSLPVYRPPDAAPVSADPEFDAYLAVVKMLMGGAIEGTAELTRRLERLEAELRAAEAGPPGPGEVNSSADVVRYLLFGASLAAADGLRRRAFQVAEASDMFWRATGSAVAPLTTGRLTGRIVGPFDRAFGRLVDRGQQRINDLVELGRANEPSSRRLARHAFLEVVDDLIDFLAENDELANLVQKKSVGLATEAVDEVRSRGVSADAIAENLVRRILRRPPRTDLPQPPDALRQTLLDIPATTDYEPGI